MRWHCFISDDLDDLSVLEQELQEQGISTPQLHVLSESDGEVERRNLHDVNSLMKRDVWHAWEMGAVVGLAAALLILLVAYVSGATSTAPGWVPFIFLAIVVMGFCTWEGGCLVCLSRMSTFVVLKQISRRASMYFLLK